LFYKALTRHAGPDQRKLLEPPLHFFIGYLKEEKRIRIHLNKNNKMVVDGKIVWFDECMNIVLQDAYEIYLGTDQRTLLGTMLLWGECVGSVHCVPHTYE
jgi:small nuclear ribonucleoprotein E